jgi:predicted O-linked N-acetylglucosamine transferase (SPINDLY family)
VAASLLHAVGLRELAAHCLEDYEDMAVRLYEQPDILADVRRHLDLNRMQLPLWDSARFAGELGDLLWRMRQRWLGGLPPAALPAAPLPAAAAA